MQRRKRRVVRIVAATAAALAAAAGCAAAAPVSTRDVARALVPGGIGAGPARVSGVLVGATPGTARSGTRVPLADVADIAFATPEVGYAIGSTRSPSEVTYPLKTTDGGRVWTIDGPGLSFATADAPLAVGSIGVASSSEAYIWGGPGSGSTVVVTTDGGAHWWRAGLGQATLAVSAKGGRLWTLASTSGPSSPAPAVQLFVSSDGGRSWSLRSVIPVLRGWEADLVRISTTTAFALVANDKGSSPGTDGIVETSDGGRSWVRRSDPCVAPSRAHDRPWAERLVGTGGALWLLCAGIPSTGLQPKSVERSGDGGRTWTTVSVQLADEGRYREPAGAIAAGGYLSSPGSSGVLAATSPDRAALILEGDNTLYQTADGGQRWLPIPAAIEAQFPQQLSPLRGELVVLTKNGLWRGTGRSWMLVAGTAAPW